MQMVLEMYERLGGNIMEDKKGTDDDGIKRLENPGQYLLDTGILFEINRQILHPLGLAMEVVQKKDGTWVLGGIWDYREDGEGMLYSDNMFQRGLNKWVSFFETEGRKKHMARYKELGYIIQGKESINSEN